MLTKLCGLAELVAEACEDFRPLAYACQRGAGPFEYIFEVILAGQILFFRRPEKSGIGVIFVNVKTVLEMKILS